MSGRGCPSSSPSGRARAAVVTAAGGRGAPVGGWPFSGTPHCPALALRTRHTALRSTLPRRAGSLTGSSAAARERKEPRGRPELHPRGRLGAPGQGPWGLCLSVPSCPVRRGHELPVLCADVQ